MKQFDYVEEIQKLNIRINDLEAQVNGTPKKWEPQRQHNRLLAYVAEFDNGWEPRWEDYDQKKWYVYYIHPNHEWNCMEDIDTEDAGKVYMSEGCAKGLVDKLNKKEVEL